MSKRMRFLLALLSLTIILSLVIALTFKDKPATVATTEFTSNGVTCRADVTCYKEYLKFAEDRSSNKELIVKLMLWDKVFAKEVIRSFMEIPEFKNDCYSTLGEAGTLYAKEVGKVALKFELALCRSVFKLGVLEALKDDLSTNESKNYIAHLCDLDPEKNGCTDGVGRLAYFYGFTAQESSELCKLGEVGVAEIETYYEGCMGGYGNWSRFGSFWEKYTSIDDIFSIYCKGVEERGLPSCLGYGMRSYVRYGIANNTAVARLKEFYEVCRDNKSIENFCGTYIGFVLADVYNDKYGKVPVLTGEKMAKKLDQYCQLGKPEDCYSSFVAWYINQWAFSSKDGAFAKDETLLICSFLKNVKDKELCVERVKQEEARYRGRLVNAGNE